MLPVLYSFRRCPYAIRARLAIKYAGIQVELREVVLADKPDELLRCSAKGTVPVLQLPGGEVIDESLDIMHWALAINDPQHWLPAHNQQESHCLIAANDTEFKKHLDHYKYADRFPEHPAAYYRSQGENFLADLNTRLASSSYLSGDTLTLTDVALFPFVRQFAHVDKPWFDQTTYSHLQNWLQGLLESSLFIDVMEKSPRWHPGDKPRVF